MEGCCEEPVPGVRRGLSPSPYHPHSPSPADREWCRALPSRPLPILVRLWLPARGPQLRA